MANFISIADGNFTDSATWATTSSATNACLVSTNTGTSACDTNNRDSATFIPAASAIQYIAVRLASRAAGSPTNTLTVILRNSTGSSDALTWVVNVSDLPVCDTTWQQGGWIILKASSAHTPNGTDSYLIRMVLSATTTAVSFYTNGTGYNWQRLIGLTTTGAPGAGDDMHIGGWFDNTSNPCSTATRSIVMNQTTNTDYGSNNTNERISALTISKGGTLAFPTDTTSLLQLSGALNVFTGGTLTIGSTGTPVDATHTATLQFDCGSNEAFGLIIRRGAVFNACWVGYTKSWTLLTANLAVSGTALTVADSTGWKSGDNIVIATTDTTASHSESKTLDGDAGASSMNITAGVSYAHDGDTTNKYQAEVINLTRGVTIKALNTSYRTYCYLYGGGTIRWVKFDVLGGSSNKGIVLYAYANTEVTNCAFTNDNSTVIYFSDYSTYSNTITIENNMFYETSTGDSSALFTNYAVGMNGANISISYNISITTRNIYTYDLTLTGTSIGSFNYNRCIGNNSYFYPDIYLHGAYNSFTITGNICHGGSGTGMQLSGNLSYNNTIDDSHIWRKEIGLYLLVNGNYKGYTFNNLKLTGNNHPLYVGGLLDNIIFNDCYLVADTGRASTETMYFTDSYNFGFTNVTFNNCYNNLTDGIWVPPNTGINGYVTKYALYQILWRGNPILTNGYFDNNFNKSCYFRSSTTTNIHKTVSGFGIIEKDTSTVDSKTNLIKMTPKSATIKLCSDSNVPGEGLGIIVTDGDTPVVSIYVRKTAAYNGNAPRLILRANPTLGVDEDTVLDTLSVGADTWEALGGTLPEAPIDGVYRIIIDCDGTAGYVYAAELTIDGDSVPLTYWQDGLPVIPISAGAAPPASAEISTPFFGTLK